MVYNPLRLVYQEKLFYSPRISMLKAYIDMRVLNIPTEMEAPLGNTSIERH